MPVTDEPHSARAEDRETERDGQRETDISERAEDMSMAICLILNIHVFMVSCRGGWERKNGQ